MACHWILLLLIQLILRVIICRIQDIFTLSCNVDSAFNEEFFRALQNINFFSLTPFQYIHIDNTKNASANTRL